MAKKKDEKLRSQGMPRPGIHLGDPQQDDMMNKAKRLRKDFGYSFNQSINEAERTTRQKRADAGRPVSPADITTKKQMDKFVKTGLRETVADQAAKQSGMNAVVAQQSASFIKRQIEEFTGKSQNKTMGNLPKVASFLRATPALVVASIMKPKRAAPAELTSRDIRNQRTRMRGTATNFTRK